MGRPEYPIPVGDRAVHRDDADFWVASDLGAWCVGGPTRWTHGRLILTEQRLVFRDADPYGTHHQDLMIDRRAIEAVQPVLPTRGPLGWFQKKRSTLRVSATVSGKRFVLGFRVSDPDAWVAWLSTHVDASAPPLEVIETALAAGVSDRSRYLVPLRAVSFPLLWAPFKADLYGIVRDWLTIHDVDVSMEGWRFDADLIAACEDYDMAAWREETLRLVRWLDARLQTAERRRFHRFVEDVPGWEEDAPLVLLVEPALAEQFVSHAILRATSL